MALGRRRQRRVLDRLGAADDLDRHRFADQRLFSHDETVALAVRILEGRHRFGQAAIRHDQRRVGAFVA